MTTTPQAPKTRTQLLDDLRAAKMALSLTEHLQQQVTTRPQPPSNLDYAIDTAERAVIEARATCDDLRRQIDALPAPKP